ncbi:MAG: MFS transporter, partial [Actinobacteria bacterium]
MDHLETAGPGPRRPASQRRAVISLLRRNRDFRMLFLAQVVSFTGDWFLFVALAGLVFDLTHSPGLVAAVYASLTVPFAFFMFVGGPLADRLNRQALMIVADVIRGFLALGFFLVHRTSEVWLVYVLAGAITALGAVFEPASMAAIPNLVDREDLATANVMAGATWGTMLAIGSAIGGLVVAGFGRGAGYIGDAASFLLSASLITRIRRPFAEPREPHQEHPGLFEATREAVRYARRDHRVLAMLTVKGGFGLGGGVVALLPVLAFTVYGTKDWGTGVLYGFRGLGVLAGPFLARRFIGDEDLVGLF